MTNSKEASTQTSPTNNERRDGDRRQSDAPVVSERRKVQRRRQIDPTTCERDYTNDEIEFMQALDAFKRHTGNNFPSSLEILDVIISIGYTKGSEQAQAQ